MTYIQYAGRGPGDNHSTRLFAHCTVLRRLSRLALGGHPSYHMQVCGLLASCQKADTVCWQSLMPQLGFESCCVPSRGANWAENVLRERPCYVHDVHNVHHREEGEWRPRRRVDGNAMPRKTDRAVRGDINQRSETTHKTGITPDLGKKWRTSNQSVNSPTKGLSRSSEALDATAVYSAPHGFASLRVSSVFIAFIRGKTSVAGSANGRPPSGNPTQLQARCG
jgi:hypothetical protein